MEIEHRELPGRGIDPTNGTPIAVPESRDAVGSPHGGIEILRSSIPARPLSSEIRVHTPWAVHGTRVREERTHAVRAAVAVPQRVKRRWWGFSEKSSRGKTVVGATVLFPTDVFPFSMYTTGLLHGI